MESYNHLKIEKKWQKFFLEKQIFKTQKDPKKKKFYCLEMFPYPSGNIHMGHVRNYTLGDVIANYKRMQGYNVLHFVFLLKMQLFKIIFIRKLGQKKI